MHNRIINVGAWQRAKAQPGVETRQSMYRGMVRDTFSQGTRKLLKGL